MCVLQIQYVRVMEEVYHSATFVTATTRLPVKVHKFFRLAPATKYVHMYTASFAALIDFSVFWSRNLHRRSQRGGA